MLALELDRFLGSNVKAHGSAHAPAARKREDASGGSKHPLARERMRWGAGKQRPRRQSAPGISRGHEVEAVCDTDERQSACFDRLAATLEAIDERHDSNHRNAGCLERLNGA